MRRICSIIELESEEKRVSEVGTSILNIEDLKDHKINAIVGIKINKKEVATYDLELDTKKMCLGYEEQLPKDINRIVRAYYYEFGEVPKTEYLKKRLEVDWKYTKLQRWKEY